MNSTIYYVDKSNNYYIDAKNNYYVLRQAIAPHRRYNAFMYINNAFRQVNPIIIKMTNIGPILSNALVSNTGVPYLTKDKQYILTTNTQNLTPDSQEDYIVYECINYKPCILKNK